MLNYSNTRASVPEYSELSVFVQRKEHCPIIIIERESHLLQVSNSIQTFPSCVNENWRRTNALIIRRRRKLSREESIARERRERKRKKNRRKWDEKLNFHRDCVSFAYLASFLHHWNLSLPTVWRNFFPSLPCRRCFFAVARKKGEFTQHDIVIFSEYLSLSSLKAECRRSSPTILPADSFTNDECSRGMSTRSYKHGRTWFILGCMPSNSNWRRERETWNDMCLISRDNA